MYTRWQYSLPVWILRLLVGSFFILSGLAKTIDIYGTVFKIEEYLVVWGWTVPRSLTMLGAMLLSGTEFTLGLLLALGCFRRATVWLLMLIMAGMLPLSLYIYIYDPVSDCGCFGDLLRLSNAATFWKNIIVVALLIVLIRCNPRVPGLYSRFSQWMVLPPVILYALIVGLYGYYIQPMLDFRSFAVGTHLLGEDDDTPMPQFLYSRGDETHIFPADQLPGDDWTFVERIEPADNDARTEFVITDADGEDITEDAVTGVGSEILLVVTDPLRSDISWTYFLNELADTVTSGGGRMVGLVAGGPRDLDNWSDLSMPSYPLYPASVTMLRELVRGDLAIVTLRDGIIISKRSLALADPDEFSPLYSGQNITDNGPLTLRLLTAALLAILVLLYILDSTGRLLKWAIRRHHHTDSQPQP